LSKLPREFSQGGQQEILAVILARMHLNAESICPALPQTYGRRLPVLLFSQGIWDNNAYR